MRVTVALLSKCLTAMITVEGLRPAMHANMVHNVADFVKLTPAGGTYKDLVGPASNEVVAEDLDEPTLEIFVEIIALGFF